MQAVGKLTIPEYVQSSSVYAFKMDFTFSFFLAFPFSKITAFSIETAGTLDANAELKIWASGVGGLKLNFTPKTDIFEIGQFIGQFII